MSEVSTISSAISRIGVMRDRSSRMPSLADRSRRERMRPARLAEAPHQRRVARLEEDQHRVQPAHLAQPPEDLRERRQETCPRGRRRRSRPSRCRRRAATAARASGSASSAGCRRRSSPRSSSARIACDLPDPDSPVRTMNGCAGRLAAIGCERPRRLCAAVCAASGAAPPGRPAVDAPSPAASRLAVFVLVLVADDRPRCRSGRSSRSASARAAWWPRARSSWLRAATSTRMAMLRPGATGIRMSGTRRPRIS